MNARQKAKKYKKELDQIKSLYTHMERLRAYCVVKKSLATEVGEKELEEKVRQRLVDTLAKEMRDSLTLISYDYPILPGTMAFETNVLVNFS